MPQITFAARIMRPTACGSKRIQTSVHATTPNVTGGPTLVGSILSSTVRMTSSWSCIRKGSFTGSEHAAGVVQARPETG